MAKTTTKNNDKVEMSTLRTRRDSLNSDIKKLQEEAQQHVGAIQQYQGEIQKHNQRLAEIQRQVDRLVGALALINEIDPVDAAEPNADIPEPELVSVE